MKRFENLTFRSQAGRVNVAKGFTRAALTVEDMGSDSEIEAGRVKVAWSWTRAASASQMQKSRTEALFGVLTDLLSNNESMSAP